MSTTKRTVWPVLVASALMAGGALADVGEESARPTAAAAKEPVAVKAPAQEPWANVTIPRGQAGTVLVIPAQDTVVQFAFDIVRLRPLLLVAYDDRAVTNIPAVHVWNSAASDWTRIATKQFVTGSIFDAPPPDAIIVGPDRLLPPGMAEKPGWATKVVRMPAVDLVALVNALNDTFNFTPGEWRELADRFGFKLKDLNEERRRWGKYGKPGEERPEPAPMPQRTDEAEKRLAPVPVTPEPAKTEAKGKAPEDK